MQAFKRELLRLSGFYEHYGWPANLTPEQRGNMLNDHDKFNYDVVMSIEPNNVRDLIAWYLKTAGELRKAGALREARFAVSCARKLRLEQPK